jgi:GTP-binding protein
MRHGLPTIAIIGRPNVGKSSLINRILRRREAIVHDTPGVTRDRKYFTGAWNDKNFRLIDTGGIYTNKVNSQGISFQKDIEDQVEKAIREADVVIFMVDGREGLHPFDKNIANLLRPIAAKVIVAVNKLDVVEKANEATDFYQLGLEMIIPVSAMHGLGIGDMLDKAVTMFPENKRTTEQDHPNAIKVAIVGRPNAGKSSLLNALLNEERVIVSPTPGTTRDSISEEIIREGRHLQFNDRAGIPKNPKLTYNIE